MRASVLLLAGLLLTVGIAAPVAAAPEEPPGFGRCVIVEQSAGTLSIGPVEQEIIVPALECYW